jgi:hypothetical protein
MSNVEFRRIQGVYPVPSDRVFKMKRGEVPRTTFYDIFVTPHNRGDDHLVLTIRSETPEMAIATAKQRLMLTAKWKYFDLSTIRAEGARI